ncbi:MAG: FG-GAP-like repeat-containing protein [Thermoplasmata archaeon]|nr:FG-GAP-like repeat-containing protein [Thermoplasmata archaeon]
MNFERCKKGIGSNRRGVSEVVGNILILMITVILFSAIVAYVNQIPVPEMSTKADFAATVSFETSGTTTAYLTVTHAGGVVLEATDTAVFIQAGTTTQYYKLSEDEDFPYTRWSTGSDWAKSFSVPSESTEIIVTVIDLAKDSAVWTSQVSGGSGGTPPIVLQRYVDSNNASPSADPIKAGDVFSFFVKVTDLDNDLDSSTSGVYIDSSELPSGSEIDTYEESTTDGWFRFDFGLITENVSNIDGKMIKIHAWDDAGHETISSYVVSVTVLPFDIDYYQINEAFEGGLPSYITWMNDGQGFGIYEENVSSGLADVDAPTTSFDKDELVFIRVASLRLANIFGVNSVTLTDTRTGINYVPAYTNGSTASEPFYPYTSSGGAFIYECQFSTEGLPPSAYSLAITLKSSGGAIAVFQTVKGITISEAGSPITFVPAIWVYDSDDRDTEWGTKTHPFDLLDPDRSRVYVSVLVQDATDVPTLPSVDDIRVTDMRGDTQLHGTPPSGTMLSVWNDNPDPPYQQTYEFDIDLRVNNGDQWIGGTNAYTLKISRFSDANEGVYSLSTMIYVRASTAKADFIVGAAGFMTGTSNFVNPSYMYYIENNNFFTKRTMYDYANAPSAADNYAVSGLALGDIDGDGDKDVLMGQYNSHNLYYLENSLNTFGAWQEASEITRPSADDTSADINWIATGDIDGDGDVDFAYSTHNEGGSVGRTVVVYNNTYGATGYLWDPAGAAPRYNDTHDGVRKIALEDMTSDGRDDLIVLAEGRVWIYDLLQWDSSSTVAVIPGWGVAPGNTNILDFDIADVNGDGYLDVVTVDSTSSSNYKGVRVWYYVVNESPYEVQLTGVSAEPSAGSAPSNLIEYTTAPYGNALELRENSGAEPTPLGKLDVNMTTDTLTDETYQQLKIRAKVSATGGAAAESFYIWYSIDGTMFTPLIYVPASQDEYVNFTRPLPSSVAGNELTIRITDSLTTENSAAVVETLHLDYLAIITGTFGSYAPQSVIEDYAVGWQCVAAGNINGLPGVGGDLGLEVVVAKDGSWMTYNRTGSSPEEEWAALTGWADGDSTFYARGDTMIDLHSSMASDENPIKELLTFSSPRLFKVVDVNGDGYDDVVVANRTISLITSQVALHLNMHGCDNCEWLYYVVKDIAGDYTIVDVRGGMTWLAVDDLSST